MINRTPGAGWGTPEASLLPAWLGAGNRPAAKPEWFTAPRPWANTLIPVNAVPEPVGARTTVTEFHAYCPRHARSIDLDQAVGLSAAEHTPR
jgi:hypothetical protein